ncbi:phosphotransferase family protein [Novosphingobium tardum]|uniref:Phosphotransferase family protein n=1 Tax=Novosphingobium tardum TaxID=1538021 RepID=A0ABV8RR97_9SPHN
MKEPKPADPSLLPNGLAAAVEAQTGAAITAITPRGGGGASREGAELELAWPDGRRQRAYMNYDVLRAGAGDDAAFLREAAIVRALSGPLAGAGVRVAPFIAALPDRRALLGGFVGGEANFNKLATPDERMAVATDFMGQLARLHRIDPVATPIEGMGPIEPIGELIARRIALLGSRNGGDAWDPLQHLVLAWLEQNIPDTEFAPVIVHGDAGPANFLFKDGKVTILLDWELVHYGDPMADLAMLALRMLFQPFVPLPHAFRAYEAAGGHPIDLKRLRYWRLLFQAGFAGRGKQLDPDAPPPPNLGMNMVYSAIHRRVLSEALAEAAGVSLPPVALPDAPPGPRERSFAIALDDLRDVIVPRSGDQQAAVKAKGMARLVKWWRDCERYEAGYLEAERTEIAAALGGDYATHAEAWTAYCQAVRTGAIDIAVAIRIANAHVTREAALMADAMGALAKVGFAPLE